MPVPQDRYSAMRQIVSAELWLMAGNKDSGSKVITQIGNYKTQFGITEDALKQMRKSIVEHLLPPETDKSSFIQKMEDVSTGRYSYYKADPKVVASVLARFGEAPRATEFGTNLTNQQIASRLIGEHIGGRDAQLRTSEQLNASLERLRTERGLSSDQFKAVLANVAAEVRTAGAAELYKKAIDGYAKYDPEAVKARAAEDQGMKKKMSDLAYEAIELRAAQLEGKKEVKPEDLAKLEEKKSKLTGAERDEFDKEYAQLAKQVKIIAKGQTERKTIAALDAPEAKPAQQVAATSGAISEARQGEIKALAKTSVAHSAGRFSNHPPSEADVAKLQDQLKKLTPDEKKAYQAARKAEAGVVKVVISGEEKSVDQAESQMAKAMGGLKLSAAAKQTGGTAPLAVAARGQGHGGAQVAQR